jgi:hypothetical protein
MTPRRPRRDLAPALRRPLKVERETPDTVGAMKYALGILCLSFLSVALLASPAAPGVQAAAAVSTVTAAAPRAALAAPAGVLVQDPAEERVPLLEKQLVAANAQIGALTKEMSETRALLDKTLAYLGQQALAARDFAGVLDVAEQQGFAVGENHGSRKTLLEGWRKQLAALQADLPQRALAALPTAKTAPAPAKRAAPKAAAPKTVAPAGTPSKP